ncbi:MAG: imidazole glycerol phosphate synthase subunit HisH [Alphaproteobacteria bacterium]|nr:imidazole glycerol phosphate synthase subunit HisH [Alphaproteobacteria bacterium]
MTETVAIIDYGSGNLRSAAKAFERMAGETGLGTRILVTGEARAVAAADRIVLPGVGAFGDCARGLEAVPGMWETLIEAVTVKARPFFGICVGMQLMASRGLEHGEHVGFGWIPGDVVRLAPADPGLKIPHMGWNELTFREASHPVLKGLNDVQSPEHGFPHAYFVHSFHLEAQRAGDVLATTDHGQQVTAMVGRDNLIGTQFHPEKSQRTGLTMIANFLRWRP